MVTQQIRIGTHSGTFHSDDAMACMLLTRYIPEYKNAKIIRTRDMHLLDKLDLIVDVGQHYDPSKHKYDHHQREFDLTFGEGYSIKLSGSGLIYKHFGKTALKVALEQLFSQELFQKYKTDIKEEDLNQLYIQMYNNLFQSIDAIDNGVSQYPPEVKSVYQMERSDMHNRVAWLNQSWWDNSYLNEQLNMQRFVKAMDICEEEFLEELKNSYANLFISKQIVQEAWNERHTVDPSGEIILIKQYTRFQKQIEEIEEQENLQGKIKYCIFHDMACDEYRIRCISQKNQGFLNRKGLHPEWRGLKVEDLRRVSQIPDIIFCHVSGFIGGAKSLESAIKMAKLSLEAKEN